MFQLFKKKNRPGLSLQHLRTDIHSHLIPGIDDGAKSMDDAIQMIKVLCDLGIQKIVTTPHIMDEYFPNRESDILNGLKNLRNAISEHKLNVEIEAAAEYFVDDVFLSRLDGNASFLTFGDRFILIEGSTFVENPNMLNVIFQLNTLGYHPVLAHPERYTYYLNQYDIFQTFRSKGCLLQLNLMSLVGKYGKTEKELAIRLLKDNLIDFVGTDLHQPHQLKTLSQVVKDKSYAKWIDGHIFQNSLI